MTAILSQWDHWAADHHLVDFVIPEKNYFYLKVLKSSYKRKVANHF